MNKWKIAFWCSLVLLVLTILFSIKQADRITYTIDKYNSFIDSEEIDFIRIIELVNNTNLSQNQIESYIKDDYFFNFSVTIEKDTIHFHTVKLIFKDSKLNEIRYK